MTDQQHCHITRIKLDDRTQCLHHETRDDNQRTFNVSPMNHTPTMNELEMCHSTDFIAATRLHAEQRNPAMHGVPLSSGKQRQPKRL